MAVTREQLEGSTGIAKWVIIGGVAIFVVNKISNAFGYDEEQVKAVDEAGKDPAWNPRFGEEAAKEGKTTNVLVGGSVETAKAFYTKYAKQIKEGFGYRWTDDDEIQIESAFRAMTTKAQVSMLGSFYRILYKLDLFTECRERLSPEEMLKITNYVNNLPTYVPTK